MDGTITFWVAMFMPEIIDLVYYVELLERRHGENGFLEQVNVVPIPKFKVFTILVDEVVNRNVLDSAPFVFLETNKKFKDFGPDTFIKVESVQGEIEDNPRLIEDISEA